MSLPNTLGPVLFAAGGDSRTLRYSALYMMREGEPPILQPMGQSAVHPERLDALYERVFWSYHFELPVRDDAGYEFAGERLEVDTQWQSRARIGFVSCNGQEHDDPAWHRDDRQAMWRRLKNEHDAQPFSLLLHGGDQLYADEMLQSHPSLQAWAEAEHDDKPDHRFSEEAREAATRYLIDAYALLYTQAEFDYLGKRVASVMIWDDHDIMDGWGSHPAAMLDSPIGQGLFAICRRMFMLFQLARKPVPLPEAQTGTLPPSLTYSVVYPEIAIVVPDLRSERRPEQIIAEHGWATLDQALQSASDARHLLLVSSVPLLGPRLSWVELVVPYLRKAARYEDDLRDQWQSRAHRDEWQRMLRRVEQAASEHGLQVSVLSGEIHLATRAEMPMQSAGTLRQFVASGIAHPPPPVLFARVLGWLAMFGEAPLAGQPIKLKKLPGQRRIYCAERNYLVLDQQGDRWTASWELEDSGRTPALDITER